MSGTRKLTTKEVCEYLRIGRSTFYEHYRPLLKPYKASPRKLLYRESDLQKIQATIEKDKQPW